MQPLIDHLRAAVPFAVRVEIARLRRMPSWIVETPTIARRHVGATDVDRYTHVLAEHESPLRRDAVVKDESLQAGKVRNVTIASEALQHLVIEPGDVFSYHRIVGRPSRRRGFRDGLELHNGQLTRGVGGGCCQVSNLLYLLALRSGMNIVERHRHSLDLFPDDARTVPFGCGATVFYNQADLRFANPLPHAVLIDLRVTDRHLTGTFRTTVDPGFRVTIYEREHRFTREGDIWIRENRIRRSIRRANGTLLSDHEVAHNRARVCYEPTAAATSVTA